MCPCVGANRARYNVTNTTYDMESTLAAEVESGKGGGTRLNVLVAGKPKKGKEVGRRRR